MTEQPPVRRGRRNPAIAAAMTGDVDLPIPQPEGLEIEGAHLDAAETQAEESLLSHGDVVTSATTVHVDFGNGADAYVKHGVSIRVRPDESDEDAEGRAIVLTNVGVIDQIADIDERLEQMRSERAARIAAATQQS